MKTKRHGFILGVPDQVGVHNVGGRLGAALGPNAFRKLWQKFSGKNELISKVKDQGDAQPLTTNIVNNHKIASDAISHHHKNYDYSIVIGGGHDHGFSQLKGIYDFLEKKLSRKPLIGCINLDAHLDVRKPIPHISSGSPFYLALENHILKPSHLIEFGIQSHCNAQDLWDYVESKRVKVITMNDLRNGKAALMFKKYLKLLNKKSDAIVVSFDLDCAPQSDSPGVSAPQAEGITSREIIEIMEIAGSNEKTISLGIFELNPNHDPEFKSARLAATAAYHFAEAKENA